MNQTGQQIFTDLEKNLWIITDAVEVLQKQLCECFPLAKGKKAGQYDSLMSIVTPIVQILRPANVARSSARAGVDIAKREAKQVTP